jgi:hypothetical protein
VPYDLRALTMNCSPMMAYRVTLEYIRIIIRLDCLILGSSSMKKKKRKCRLMD